MRWNTFNSLYCFTVTNKNLLHKLANRCRCKDFFWWITGTTLKTNLVWTIPATKCNNFPPDFTSFWIIGKSWMNVGWKMSAKYLPVLSKLCQYFAGFSVLPENSLMLPPFSLCDWSQRVFNGWYAGFKIYICFTNRVS